MASEWQNDLVVALVFRCFLLGFEAISGCLRTSEKFQGLAMRSITTVKATTSTNRIALYSGVKAKSKSTERLVMPFDQKPQRRKTKLTSHNNSTACTYQFENT